MNRFQSSVHGFQSTVLLARSSTETVDCGLWTFGLLPFDNIFNLASWQAVPFHFWSVVFFSFGCIVGSFLNVCIYRMPLGLSIVSPPSHCPHCKYAIPFYLNIPLLTWLMLRGRCKNCGAPISPRYFLVEFLTGLTFLACWLAVGHQSPALALVYSIFLAGLIVATFIDIEHLIIPDEITLGGIAVGLVISFLLPSLQHAQSHWRALGQSVLGGIAGWGIIYIVVHAGKLLYGRRKVKLRPAARVVFSDTHLHLPGEEIPYDEIFCRKSDKIVLYANTLELVDRCYKDVDVRLSPPSADIEESNGEVRHAKGGLKIGDEMLNPEEVLHMEAVCSEVVVSREAMGFGDVKFMAAIGAFLGWKAVLFTFMAACMIGALYGSAMVLTHRQKWAGRLYFGPFLSLGATLWIFAGPELVAWYLRFTQHLLDGAIGR